MSMNLGCDKYNLPQIGTMDSYLIISWDDDGNPDGGWQGVARRYILWAQGSRQREFNAASQDPERQEDVSLYWDIRIAEMKDTVVEALASGTTIEFWVC